MLTTELFIDSEIDQPFCVIAPLRLVSNDLSATEVMVLSLGIAVYQHCKHNRLHSDELRYIYYRSQLVIGISYIYETPHD